MKHIQKKTFYKTSSGLKFMLDNTGKVFSVKLLATSMRDRQQCTCPWPTLAMQYK